MITGKIFNIQRFCTDDGGGIRTTVFFKGCPLSCVWCHNPESNKMTDDIFYAPEKCIGCGNCVNVCPEKAHGFDEKGFHVFDRTLCENCGKCASVCNAMALELCGKNVSSDEILAEVIRDKDFFEQSGGGITLSGGEPFYQPEFALEILEKAKILSVNTCVETCGFAKKEYYERAVSLVDTFLYDVKITDREAHRKYTGVDSRLIYDNLKMISKMGGNIVLRCPIIPGINMNGEHFTDIGRLAASLSGVKSVELLPYHPLGIEKLKRLGRSAEYGEKDFLAPEKLKTAAEGIARESGKPTFVKT